jgi:serine/threonine-protein kinase
MPTGAAVLPDRYREPRLVARGGMGEVYGARDTTLGRVVAIKLLDERYALDDDIRRRFEREALAAARVSTEPGIVTIFDVGECAGRPFIVMEYLPGGSLQDVLGREGAQPPARAVRWVEEAAAALDRAHAGGVVHRDVKPANLLLDADGVAHVADFGVANAAGLDSLTQPGTVIGTSGYLSPEPAEGRGSSPASDRYALGVVAFELLVGSRPFEGGGAAAEAARHVESPVQSLAARRRGLPPALDPVFARALAKDPARRFPTCGAFAAALRGAFAAGVQTTRVVPVARRRRQGPRLLVVLLLLLLAGAGAIAALLATRDGTGGGGAGVVTVTVTGRGTTVQQTVTAAARATTAPAGGGSTAAADGYALLRAGDGAGAVPLLEQAARAFSDSG